MPARHRAKEFIRFLKKIDRCVKKYLDLHLVLDNYRTRIKLSAMLLRFGSFRFRCIATSVTVGVLQSADRG